MFVNVTFPFAITTLLFLTASGLSASVAAQPTDAAVAAVDTVVSTGASPASAVTDTMHDTAATAGLSMTPDSVKKIDTAVVAPAHGNVAAAAAVLTDSTVNPPASDSGHQAQPVDGASPAAAVTAAPSPVSTSNYYGGMSPSGQGAGRGVAGQSPSGRTARKLLITTDSAAAPNADSSISVIDTLKHATIQSTDTTSRMTAPQAPSPSSPVYKMGKTAKIITAVGTCAVVGGIVTFILVKKHEDANNDDQGIPDPPDPPGY